jgi:hypothetical protein
LNSACPASPASKETELHSVSALAAPGICDSPAAPSKGYV